ncbi:hypothetical protein [Microvirga sp. CF3016]|uniref:hypothetical protein n=1 Tax=Microvirga sp. CF3016 TaxID=3110181 RepID=UPI002E7629C7|nr:hypothetical protein [Microvirga sp. CF3016]MEE1611130.1 hypothetical protein [Microvirga sp. CF3016]
MVAPLSAGRSFVPGRSGLNGEEAEGEELAVDLDQATLGDEKLAAVHGADLDADRS